jgi:branched-chain amino acid transport system substrate-binding protein
MAEERAVSRRDFLKLAGVAGASIGVAGGLGGLLAACGGGDETTTTVGPTTTVGATTTTAGATTTTAGATTTVSAGPEAGRAIKLGYCAPKTGNFASFAVADDWILERAKGALKDGILGGDGKTHAIEFVVADTQSSTDRASQVAGDLVNNSKVDMLLASGTPDTANPVSDQGEVGQCPTLLSFAPWQALFFDATGAPVEKKWTYGNMLGSEQTIASFIDAFDKSGVATNKKVGMLFMNDADFKGWMAPNAAPKVFAAGGYELTVPDPYAPGNEDFTSFISAFKSAGCEIICGTNDPPFFASFMQQSLQQNYHPKFISSGKALLFASAVESYANKGIGLIGECAWHPSWKIKDTLIPGEDSETMAADFEAKTNTEWTAALGCYGKVEWAIDVFKRATNPDDKATIIAAIQTTKGDFQQGRIDFTEPVSPDGFHPIANNYKPYIGAVQWLKGTKWPVEPIIISAATSPGVTVQGKAVPMVYS